MVLPLLNNINQSLIHEKKALYLRVDSTPSDERTDRIAVSNGFAEFFEVESTKAIGASITIRFIIECMACSCGGENSSLHGAQLLFRRLEKVGGADDGGIAFVGVEG